MKKSMFLVLFLGLSACASPLGDNVTLSSDEKARSVALAEQRQSLNMQAQKFQAEYQANMNRISEQQTQLNIQAAQLCFDFKKAHKLDPGGNYSLDEWRGVLIKQGK